MILLRMPLSGIHDISVASLDIYFQKIIAWKAVTVKLIQVITKSFTFDFEF